MTNTLTLAKALMERPSVTPDDAGCQNILRNELENAGFKCESMRFADVDNLWARFGTASPLFVFAGHTDVVPTGAVEDWTSPPFEPVIRDDLLFGRGAQDMKAAVAAMTIAAIEFVKTTANFKGSIGLLITSDEEGHAIDGTKKVLEALAKRGEKIDYAIVGEPSCNKAIGDRIRIGRRGSLHGTLTVHGKQGHVAHPHLAKNPIHDSMMALHELARTEWDKGNKDFPPTSFQISNIHSGTGAGNVIPGHLEVLFNFRFSTAVTVEELKKRTREILKKHDFKFDLDWEVGGEPFLTTQGKLISTLQSTIKALCGIDTELSTAGGTSDGRFIAPYGTEVIELGVCNTTAHQVDEYVPVKDLEKLTQLYLEILKKIFQDRKHISETGK